MLSFLSRFSATALLIALPFASHAVTCSDTGGQYEAWKTTMAAEAKRSEEHTSELQSQR